MSAATRDASEIAVAFSRVLRGGGLAVPTSSTIAFAEALALHPKVFTKFYINMVRAGEAVILYIELDTLDRPALLYRIPGNFQIGFGVDLFNRLIEYLTAKISKARMGILGR